MCSFFSGGEQDPTPPSLMNLLCWNCRGLGNAQRVQALQNIMRLEDPNLVFLCETKCSVNSLQVLKVQLGFYCFFFCVDALSQYGGLCFLWKNECNVRILSKSMSHIDSEIRGIGDSKHWRFTIFYGNPAQANRHHSWNLVRQISSTIFISWVVSGDFNELLHSREKVGGAARSIGQSWISGRWWAVVISRTWGLLAIPSLGSLPGVVELRKDLTASLLLTIGMMLNQNLRFVTWSRITRTMFQFSSLPSAAQLLLGSNLILFGLRSTRLIIQSVRKWFVQCGIVI